MKSTLIRLRDLIAREPVVVRTVIGLVVAGALVWGVDLSDVGERVAQTVEIVAAIVAALGLAWARQGATPSRDVVAVVEQDGTTVAGPASPLPDGTPVTPGLTDHEALHLARVHDDLPPDDPARPAIESTLAQARRLA